MICWPEEEEWWTTNSSVAQEGVRHPELDSTAEWLWKLGDRPQLPQPENRGVRSAQ